MSRRRIRTEADLGTFMKQYGRKKRPGQGEPNDRKYSRQLEESMKRMDPEELDEVLRGEDDADERPAAP